MNTAIELKQLYRQYPGFSLDNVNLTLPSGCIMGLIGENGAGKSTLIRLILDLIPKKSGIIQLFGENDLKNAPHLKEQIGVVLDETTFANHLTAKEVNRVMKYSFKTWDSKVFFSYLDRFSLPLQKRVETFSRGMKMKLSLAVALSHNSKLLILDEATNGLDPSARQDVLEICLEFIQTEEKSVLLSSHILSDLEKICDYITLLHKGKIIFSEEKDILLQQYALLRCNTETLCSLNKNAILSVRNHQFGKEALVLKKEIPANIQTENTSIEDMMIFMTQGGRVS